MMTSATGTGPPLAMHVVCANPSVPGAIIPIFFIKPSEKPQIVLRVLELYLLKEKRYFTGEKEVLSQSG
jgi:hypothetical protein